MNFFKSVFSDDPDPPESESVSQSPNNAQQIVKQDDPNGDSSPSERRSDSNPDSDASGYGGWKNFGGLMRTLTTKSESIIETYRRDLKEFSSGLKKEIEVAQGSLENVGHAIDEFGNSVVKGTAQIISQGKDVIRASNLESDSDSNSNQRNSSEKSLNSNRYSRYDAQVHSIQGDASTYCDEPEDLIDYNNWKLEFSLEGKSEEIESFLKENEAMESLFKRVVPNSVDHETFWYRYYYKVYKLKKAEDVRARLVRRMSREEEELTWDFEDDDDKEYEGKAKPDLMTNREVGVEDLGKRVDEKFQAGISANNTEVGANTSNVEELHNLGEKESKGESRDSLLQSKELGNETDKSIEESKVDNLEVGHDMGDKSKESIKVAGNDKVSNSEAVNKNGSAAEADKKVTVERKPNDGKSSNKDNSSSLDSTQHSAPGEEDLGWDEIEDLSSIDEKKASPVGSPNKVDLRKRLSTAEEEEDLSWDIEDDDEPVKT